MILKRMPMVNGFHGIGRFEKMFKREKSKSVKVDSSVPFSGTLEYIANGGKLICDITSIEPSYDEGLGFIIKAMARPNTWDAKQLFALSSARSYVFVVYNSDGEPIYSGAIRTHSGWLNEVRSTNDVIHVNQKIVFTNG